LSYHVRRVDDNQPEIVKAFRDLGCSVWITSSMGRGAPDLVIGARSINLLVEVKDGAKSRSKRNLTPDEEKFKERWKGQYCIVSSVEEVVELVNSLC
jgi:Holliday junction resolvase